MQHGNLQLILHNSRLPSLIVAPHFDKWPHLTRFLNMKEPPGETPSVSSYFYFFFLSFFLFFVVLRIMTVTKAPTNWLLLSSDFNKF